MFDHFKLCLATKVKEPTTLGGTVLDLTFTKNIKALLFGSNIQSTGHDNNNILKLKKNMNCELL